MAKLLFKNAGLRKIMAHNKSATVFRRSYAGTIEEYERVMKKDYDFSDPHAQSMAFSETDKPLFFFVKDEGIYLMSAAKMEDIPKDGSHVCYAVGYAPGVSDLWERCREAVGGDDFAQDLEAESLYIYIERGDDILIDVTATHFSLKAVSYKTKAAK